MFTCTCVVKDEIKSQLISRFHRFYHVVFFIDKVTLKLKLLVHRIYYDLQQIPFLSDAIEKTLSQRGLMTDGIKMS